MTTVSTEKRGRKWLWVSTILAMLALHWPIAAFGQERPNVVLIVSDDQGYRDLGCFGSTEVKTPQLDRLATRGVRLTQFYVTWPACTPSRASLLTGRYPQRNGMYDMIRNEAPDYGHKYTPEQYAVTWERIGGMDLREVLLPQPLTDVGYRCGIFGKWDLGVHRRFLPLQRGFHRFYGFTNTGIDYFTHERYGVPSMYDDNKPTEKDKGTYCTDLFHREAMAFLKDHFAQHRDKPFFLYLPYNAPHSASNLDWKIRGAPQGTPAWKKLYPHLKDDYAVRKKPGKYGGNAEVPSKTKRRLEYAASISHMDDSIGKVLDLIDKQGKTQNTIVIFFSDNGGGGGSDNKPLRGGKGQMFEGGIRVPAIVSWPARLKPAVSDTFLSALEITPTLWKAAGVKPDERIVLDGFDMLPSLNESGSEDSTVRKRGAMFWQRRGDKAARVGHWKWVESERGNGLYDLSNDPGEKKDLSKQQPDALAKLRSAFAAWRKEMDNAEPRGPFRDY